MTDDLKQKTNDFIDNVFKAEAKPGDVLLMLFSEPGRTYAIGLGTGDEIVDTIAVEMVRNEKFRDLIFTAGALYEHLEECPKCKEGYLKRR